MKPVLIPLRRYTKHELLSGLKSGHRLTVSLNAPHPPEYFDLLKWFQAGLLSQTVVGSDATFRWKEKPDEFEF